ncbi:MAG: hypothetical protein AB1344_00625 [Pseudomonadota bacterium]
MSPTVTTAPTAPPAGPLGRDLPWGLALAGLMLLSILFWPHAEAVADRVLFTKGETSVSGGAPMPSYVSRER